MVLFLGALRANRFFSSVVRLQRDRGHAVCDTGPYRVIRHPGNLGMIVGTLGLPLLFLSAWSAVPAGLAAALLVKRTQLEDAFLGRELTGYDAYQQGTRFRLVPGVW
jgi:protein-S-isoprenylcysteine O-methyltransferase Ste14